MDLKVLFYRKPSIHHKIEQAIHRMCHAVGCALEVTPDLQRVRQGGYTLVVSPNEFIPPSDIPQGSYAIVGPQLWVFPSGPIVGTLDERTKGRYVHNSLSDWVHDYCLDMAGSLVCPTHPLPTGVDTVTFAPNGTKRDLVLLYTKLRSPLDVFFMKALLAHKGIEAKEYSYGSYREGNFISDLQRAKFMIVVDRHESQGYALQEAMSCGVPLLVWDVQTMYEEWANGSQVYHDNGHALTATAVPYWDDRRCGIRVRSRDELPEAIDRMQEQWSSFNPRDYVVETLSDRVCMQRWFAYFGIHV